MEKNKLIDFLNIFLRIEKFKDSSKNWLQVDFSKEEIKKIWYAVDATSYIFDLAIQNNIDLILTHHGIFWWVENVLTDIYYERIAKFKNQQFHWAQVISPFAETMWFERKIYNFGKKEYFTSVAIVSGWAGELVKEAHDKWYDIYITWEAVHWQLTFAKEIWQSILLWWHRETEKIWPKCPYWKNIIRYFIISFFWLISKFFVLL